MQSRRFSGLPLIGILAVIYFIAGKLGLMLASLHASASPVWPPAGIALAGLLLLGYRAWPGIFIGAFLVNVTTAGNVATAFAIATGNTLEALVGAWLVNRFAGGTNVFDRPQGVFKFALAAGISTIISPAFGVTSLARRRLCRLGKLRRDLADMVARRCNWRSCFHSPSSPVECCLKTTLE